jgi:hypothetical protein
MMAKHILVLVTIHFVSNCAHLGPTIDMWQDFHPCHQIFPYVMRYNFKVFYLCDQEYIF